MHSISIWKKKRKKKKKNPKMLFFFFFVDPKRNRRANTINGDGSNGPSPRVSALSLFFRLLERTIHTRKSTVTVRQATGGGHTTRIMKANCFIPTTNKLCGWMRKRRRRGKKWHFIGAASGRYFTLHVGLCLPSKSGLRSRPLGR